MTPLDPILFRELPLIRKIIDDETWLEGERRGCAVSPADPVVRENVCQVILRIGAQMRATLERAAAQSRPFSAAVQQPDVSPAVTHHAAA